MRGFKSTLRNMFNKLSIVYTLSADIKFVARCSINNCLIVCINHERTVVYTVDFDVCFSNVSNLARMMMCDDHDYNDNNYINIG